MKRQAEHSELMHTELRLRLVNPASGTQPPRLQQRPLVSLRQFGQRQPARLTSLHARRQQGADRQDKDHRDDNEPPEDSDTLAEAEYTDNDEDEDQEDYSDDAYDIDASDVDNDEQEYEVIQGDVQGDDDGNPVLVLENGDVIDFRDLAIDGSEDEEVDIEQIKAEWPGGPENVSLGKDGEVIYSIPRDTINEELAKAPEEYTFTEEQIE